jgi:hypothetical protein
LAPDPNSVSSRDEFDAFVRGLSAEDRSTWANATSGDYLESLAAWVEDTRVDLEPSWQAFATIIIAATSTSSGA